MKDQNDTEKTPFCFVSMVTLGLAALVAAVSFAVVFWVTGQMSGQINAYQAKSGSVSLLERSANVSDLSLAASTPGSWEWSFEALPEYDLDGSEEGEGGVISSDPIPVALGADCGDVGKDLQALLVPDDFSFDSISRAPVPVVSSANSSTLSPTLKTTASVEAPKPVPPKSGQVVVDVKNDAVSTLIPAPVKAEGKVSKPN